jgi:hypothetical protein
MAAHQPAADYRHDAISFVSFMAQKCGPHMVQWSLSSPNRPAL